MSRQILIDTGPLVSLLDADSQFHDWAAEVWQNAVPPALTCEAVITEATFLFQRDKLSIDPLFRLVASGALKIAISASDSLPDIQALMKRYRNVPMSFADACLVRLSEKHSNHSLVTFDSDFTYYRKHGNKAIPIISPR